MYVIEHLRAIAEVREELDAVCSTCSMASPEAKQVLDRLIALYASLDVVETIASLEQDKAG